MDQIFINEAAREVSFFVNYAWAGLIVISVSSGLLVYAIVFGEFWDRFPSVRNYSEDRGTSILLGLVACLPGVGVVVLVMMYLSNGFKYGLKWR